MGVRKQLNVFIKSNTRYSYSDGNVLSHKPAQTKYRELNTHTQTKYMSISKMGNLNKISGCYQH